MVYQILLNKYYDYKKYNLKELNADDTKIKVIKLENEDIKRNPIIKKVMNIYQFDKNNIKEISDIAKTKIYSHESSCKIAGV